MATILSRPQCVKVVGHWTQQTNASEAALKHKSKGIHKVRFDTYGLN